MGRQLGCATRHVDTNREDCRGTALGREFMTVRAVVVCGGIVSAVACGLSGGVMKMRNSKPQMSTKTLKSPDTRRQSHTPL
jgi:hypothetical protein